MSNPTWPVYKFKVSTETLQRYSWAQPYSSVLEGNQTVTEADYMKNTRSTWLCNLAPGCNFIAEGDGFTFTAYGLQAVYLKRLYATGLPGAVLQLVS